MYIQTQREGDQVKVQVKEWGNSQGIRFPKSVLQEAGIAVNDTLTVEVEDGKIILYPSFRHKTLEERAAEYDGKLGHPDGGNLFEALQRRIPG